MDCLDDGLITPADLGVDQTPRWEMATFDVVGDSMHNAELGIALLNQMILPDGKIPLQFGARKFARRLAREKGREVLDRFVYNAFARQGWMVPNQYWTPGVFAPMAITGKYYMHYGRDFLPPRELGKGKCPPHVQGADAGQSRNLPLSPGLGGNIDSRYRGKYFRGKRGVSEML
jgi:glyceraldehyde-3-phosphate dehydrogenase (ferredoxin)